MYASFMLSLLVAQQDVYFMLLWRVKNLLEDRPYECFWEHWAEDCEELSYWCFCKIQAFQLDPWRRKTKMQALRN